MLGEDAMVHYAAFDLSDRETAIHVLDEPGKPVWKGKRLSKPESPGRGAAALRDAVAEHRVGEERASSSRLFRSGEMTSITPLAGS